MSESCISTILFVQKIKKSSIPFKYQHLCTVILGSYICLFWTIEMSRKFTKVYIVVCRLGSVVSIATGYRLDVPGIESWWEARFSTPVQTGPGTHPASCTMGNGSFPGVKSGQGVTLTPHPLLVPWSWKNRAIPLLSLWAVWPVQSLIACTRVHFTFYLI
jgi:hypothetical protein